MLAAVVLMAACDKIEKPYKVEHPKVLISVDTPSFEPVNSAIKKILAEEYTGHRCVNCPQGHKTLADLKANMKDTLVVLALHVSEQQAAPDPNDTTCPVGYIMDYRTTAGNAYENNFSIGSLPAAVFNRTLINGMYGQNSVSSWKTMAESQSHGAADAGLQIIPVWNANEDTVFVFVNTTLFTNINNSMRLCVLLSENNIVSPQKNGKPAIGSVPSICDYTHQHMLRTNISPIEGTPISISQQSEHVICAYALPWNSKWQKNNSNVVAMLLNADTQEVMQVEEIQVAE